MNADLETMFEVYAGEDNADAEEREHYATLRDAFSLPLTPEKAELITREIYRYEARRDAAKEAAAKCRADAERYGERYEMLRAGLLGLLQASNLKKIETAIGVPSRTPPKERVVLAEDVAEYILEWPDDVRAACVKPKIDVDKNALKRFPKTVVAELPGVKIETGEESLTIR